MQRNKCNLIHFSIKKLILISASVFLIFLSYQLLDEIYHWNLKNVLLLVTYAFLINLYITGIFAFAGFALPTYKLMSNSYYYVKNRQLLENLYKRMGVAVFRKFLLITFWYNIKQRKNYFSGKRTGLENFSIETKTSEFGHFGAFIIVLIVSLYFIYLQYYLLFVITSVINVLFNFYPVILQRYHRMRIQSIIHKL